MNKAKIKELVDELDRAVPIENARVAAYSFGGGLDECLIESNEHGDLRLGVELLKGALAGPRAENSSFLNVKLDGLVVVGYDLVEEFFGYKEKIEKDEPKSSFSNSIRAVVFFGIVILFFISAIVGFVEIVKFVFSIHFK